MGDAPELFDKEELIAKFGPEEYVVFSLMLLVSALIGKTRNYTLTSLSLTSINVN